MLEGGASSTRTGHGDLYAILKIVMPAKSNPEAMRLWKELSSTAAFNPRKEWEV